MTAQEVRLCGLLLQEHFGKLVEKVGTHLLRIGPLSLRAIAHETGTPLDLVLLHIVTRYCCNRLCCLCENEPPWSLTGDFSRIHTLCLWEVKGCCLIRLSPPPPFGPGEEVPVCAAATQSVLL